MTSKQVLSVVLGMSLTMGFSNAFVLRDAPRQARTLDTHEMMVHDTTMKRSTLVGHKGTIQPAFHVSHRSAALPLHLFGNMFGSDDASRETKVLASISGLGNTEQKYDSLAEYIQQWSKFFQDDPKKMGLLTPVNVLVSDTNAVDGVAQVSGVKIVFKRTKTGGSYKSSKEERAMEEGGTTVNKKKEIREGGVEILVEQLNDGKVQVRARRCETDEETTIKEMSEEAIVNDLKNAVGVWKKQGFAFV